VGNLAFASGVGQTLDAAIRFPPETGLRQPDRETQADFFSVSTFRGAFSD
jgi:hypothetical protein